MSIANANLHHLTQPSTQLVNFIGPPNMVAIPQSQGQFVLAVQPNSWASTVGTSTISNAATMDCQFSRISQDKQTSSKIIADNSVSIVSGNNFLSSQQAPFNNPNASSQETTDRIVATGSTIPSSNQLVAPMSFSTSNFIQPSTLLGTGPPHILTTGQQPSTTLVQQANGQYILASRINTVPQSGQVSSVGAFASGNPDSISTGPSTGPLLMSTNGPASNSVGTSSEDLASRQLITTSSTVSPINQLVQVILANGQLATTTLANLQACGLASPNLSLNQPTLPTGPSVGQISYFSPTNSGLIQPGSVQQQASAPLQTQLIADSSGQLFAVSSPPTMYNSLLPSNLTTMAPLNSGQSPQYVQIATPGGIVLVSADQVQNISTQQSLASSSSSASILSSNVPLSVNHSNNTADSEKNNTNQTGCNQINPIDSSSPQIQQVTNLSERVKQTKTTANGNSRFLSRLTNIEQTGTSKTNPYDTSNRVITTIICGASKTPDIESDGQISQATQVSLSPSNSSSPTDISSSPHASQSTVSSTTVISTHDQSSNSSSTRPLTLAATTTATTLMSDDQTTIYRSISVESQTLSSASPLSIGSASMEPESTTHSSATVANTINNTDATVVDGVNLEEIKEFARQFKIRRLSLGLTQTQVGQALSATEGPSYSQSAICRFEKLDITPKSAQKIKPILEQWMQEAEDRYKSGNNNLTDFIGSDSHKKRKRRTSFTPSALEILNAFFEKNTHPSGSEMTALADRLRYDREVVRVWFCNKRQALRNTVKKVEPSNTIIT